jgi:hypothetical protein
MRKKKTNNFKDTAANRKKRWGKKSPLARIGKKNGAYKHGNSPHSFRRKANAGKGQVVHHKNKNKKDSKKSNLKKTTKAGHNKLHPEKGRKGRAAQKRKKTKKYKKRKK